MTISRYTKFQPCQQSLFGASLCSSRLRTIGQENTRIHNREIDCQKKLAALRLAVVQHFPGYSRRGTQVRVQHHVQIVYTIVVVIRI